MIERSRDIIIRLDQALARAARLGLVLVGQGGRCLRYWQSAPRSLRLSQFRKSNSKRPIVRRIN